MPKAGIEIDKIQPFLRDRVRTTGWSLCIGAGTSLPLFPSWESLVASLFRRVDGAKANPDALAELGDCYSFDALIAAARNRLAISDDDFSVLIRDELYSKLQSLLSAAEFQVFCDVLASNGPVGPEKDKWASFLTIIRKHAAGCSAVQLADNLLALWDNGTCPSSVLSFNAEPLLATLTHALMFERFARRHASPEAGELSRVFDLVTHSISGRQQGRVPYYFCHGLLAVPDPSGQHPRKSSSDKLVFSENSYLGLANTTFSWQSSVFLEACSQRPILFVGVSLTDANMRRWLAWSHTNRQEELLLTRQFDGTSSRHFWINRRPKHAEAVEWHEAVMAHLGVRIIWLNDWAELNAALVRLFGL